MYSDIEYCLKFAEILVLVMTRRRRQTRSMVVAIVSSCQARANEFVERIIFYYEIQLLGLDYCGFLIVVVVVALLDFLRFPAREGLSSFVVVVSTTSRHRPMLISAESEPG